MKTEQIIDRNLNGVAVRQSTKTRFFNANDLLSLYSKQKGAKEKRITDYLDNAQTKSYMSAIQADSLNTANSRELEYPLVEPYYTKRGKYGGTWMHPYLFIDFAMWLSPEFKLTCVKWIYDKLIDLRLEGGDTFKLVNLALFNRKPTTTQYEYSNEAKMINKLVFGTPEGGQRNGATEKQLELLTRLQKADVHFIQQGLDYYDRFVKLNEMKSMLSLIA